MAFDTEAVFEDKGEDGNDDAVQEEVGEEADADGREDEDCIRAPLNANGRRGRGSDRHV